MRGTLHVARRSSSTSSSGEVSGELAGGGGDGGEEGVDNSSSGVVLLSALPRAGHGQDAAIAGGMYGGGGHQQVSKLTTPNDDSTAISSMTTHDMTLPPYEYVSKTLPRSAKFSPNHSQNDKGGMTSQDNGANGIASVDTGVKVRPKSSTMKNLKFKLRRKSSGELPISNTAVLTPEESGEPPPSSGEKEKKGRRGLLGSKTLSRSMENLFKRNKLSKAATIDIGEPVAIIPCYDENHRPERLSKGTSSQSPRSGGSGSQPQLMRSQSLDNLDAADRDTNVDNVDLTVTSGYQKTRTSVITGVGVGAGLNHRRQTGIITNGSIPRPQGAPPPVPVMGSATRRLRSRSLDLSSQQRQVILTAINIDETPDVESKDNDDAFVEENNQGHVDSVGNVKLLDKRNIDRDDHNVSGELSNTSSGVSRDRYNSDYSDFSDYSEYSNCSSFHNSSSIYSSGSANNYTVNPPVTDHLYGNMATIFPSTTSNVNNNNDDNDEDYGWSDDDEDDGSSTQPVITENVYGNAAVVAAAKAGLAEKWRDNMETEPSNEEESPGHVALTQHLQPHVQKHQHGQHTMLDTAAPTVAGLEVGSNSNSTVKDGEDTNPSRQSSPVVMPGAQTMTKTSTFSRNDAIQQDRSRDCPAVPPGSGGVNQAVPQVLPGESAGALLEENRQESIATGGGVNANVAIPRSPVLSATGAGLRTGGQKTPSITWRTKQELPALPQLSRLSPPPGGNTPRHLGLDVRKSTPPGGSTFNTGSGAKTQQGKRRATTLVRPSVPPPEVPSATPVSPTTTHAPQKVVAHGLQYLVDDTKDGIVVCDDLEWALKQFDDIICEDEDDGTKLCPDADDIEENRDINNDKKDESIEAVLIETKAERDKSVLEVKSKTKSDHSNDTNMGFKSKNVLLKIKQLEEGKLARGKNWEGGKEEATPKDSGPSDDSLLKGRKGILKSKGDKGKLGASSQPVGMLLERKQKEQGNQWQKKGYVQGGRDLTVVADSHATPTDWQKKDLGRSQSPTSHHHQMHHQKPAGTTGAPPHNKPPFTYNKNPDIALHNKHVSGATRSESTLSEIGLKAHLKTSHDHHQTTTDWPVVKDGSRDSKGTSVEDNNDNGNGTDSTIINPKEDILQQELKSHIQRLRQCSGLTSTNLSADSQSVEEETGGGGGIVEREEETGGNLVTKSMVPKKGPPVPVPKKPSGLMDKLVRGKPQVNSSSDSLNESLPTSTTPLYAPQPDLTAPKNIKTKPGLMTMTDRYGNSSNNWHDEDSGAPGGIPAHSVDHGGVGVKGRGGAMAKSSPGQYSTDQSLEGLEHQQQHRPLSPPSLPLSKVLSSGALAARRREMVGVSSEGGDAGDGGPRSGVVDTGALNQGSHLKVNTTATGKTNTDRSTKLTSNQDLTSYTSSKDVTTDVDTSGGSIADRIKLLSGSKNLHPGGGPVKSSKPNVPPKSAQTVRRFREKLSSSGSEKVRSPSSCSERSLSPSWSPDRLHGNDRVMQGTSEEVFSCHDNDDAGYAQCGLNATSAAYIRSNTPRGFSPRSPTKFKFNIGTTGPKSPQSKAMSSKDSLNMVPAKPEKSESRAEKSEKSLAIKGELGKVLQNKSQSRAGNFPAGKSQTSKSPEKQKPAMKEVAMYAKVNKMSTNPSLQLVSTGERVILTPSQIKAKVQARNKSTSATKWSSIPPELPAKPSGLKPDPPPKTKLSDNEITEGTPVVQLKGSPIENRPIAIKRRPTLPKKPVRMLAKLRSQSAEDLLNMDPLGAVGAGEEGGGDEGVVHSDGEDTYNDVGPGVGINVTHLHQTPHTLLPSDIPNMTTTTTTNTDFTPDTYDDIDMLTTGCRNLHNRQLPAVPTEGECKTGADAGVATLHHNSLYVDDSELPHQDGDYNINRRRIATNREISALHENAVSGSHSEAGADKDSTHTSRSDIRGTTSVGEVGALAEDLYEDIGSPTGYKAKGTGVSDTSNKGGKPWSRSYGDRHRRRDQYEQVSIDDSEDEDVDNKQEQESKGHKVGEEKEGEQEKGSGPKEVSATGNTAGEANYKSELSLPVSRPEGVYEELPDPDDHRSSASRRVAAAKGAMEDGSDRRMQAPVARIQPFRPHAYDEVCIDDDGDGTPTIINTNPSQPQPNKPSATKHLSKLANILKQNKLNFSKSKNVQEVETESEDPPPSKLKASLSSPCINSGGEFFPEEEQLGMSSHSDRKLAKRTSLGGATTTSSNTEDAISLNSYTDSISSMGSTPGGLNGDGEGDANWRRDRRQVKSLIMDEQFMEGNEHMGGRGYSSADSLSIHSGSDSTMSADSGSTGEAKMTHDDHMKHLAKVNQKVNKSLGARHLSKLYVATLKEKTATLKEKTSNIRNLPKYFSKSATSLQMASRKSLGDISGQMSRMLKKNKAQPSAPTPDYTSDPEFSDGDWSDSEFDTPDYEVANNGPVIMSMQPPKLPPARQHRPLPPTPPEGQPEMEEDYLAPTNPIMRAENPSALPPRYIAPSPPGLPNGTPPWKKEEEHDPDDYEEMGVNRGGFTNSPSIPKPPIPSSNSSNSSSDISASILNARNGLRKIGHGQGVQTPPKPPVAAKPSTPPRPAPKTAAKAFRQWPDAGGVPPVPNTRGAADNPGVAPPPPREINGAAGGGDMRLRALAGARKLPTLPVGYIPNLKSPEINKRNPWKDATPAKPPSPPPTKPIPTIPRGPNIGGPPLPTPPRPQRTVAGPPSIPSPRQPLAVTPQSNLDDLYSYYWFHGTMTRDQVTERLYSINRDGTYILRKSNKGGKDNPYTLSILYNEKVWNLHIRLRTDNTYALGNHKENEKTFSSVPELVEYHTQRNLILAGSRGGETTLIDCPSVTKRDHLHPR